MNQHLFLNLSITPIECSLFCSSALATQYFGLADQQGWVEISKDEFTAISMEGEGLDAGQRVLELSSPLAIAGISIFFITTYFSDYILVPTSARGKVVEALEARGFAFEQHDQQPSHGRHTKSPISQNPSLPDDLSVSPDLPPTVTQLQSRTIALLKQYRIAPTVQRDIRLIHCAARSDAGGAADLQLGLVRCLAHAPRFLSVTLTGTEPASLLLEPEGAEAAFGGARGAATGLARAAGDVLIPIMLNLGRLSLESSGIVCGLAGKLAGSRSRPNTAAQGGPASPLYNVPIEMSYLSTARGAAVLVAEDEVDRAVAALRGPEDEQGIDIVE